MEKWWNGMAAAAEEDMKPASAPGLGMKSASAEEEAPAMAAIEDRTWQSPNIPPASSSAGGRRTGGGRNELAVVVCFLAILRPAQKQVIKIPGEAWQGEDGGRGRGFSGGCRKGKESFRRSEGRADEP